MKHSMKYVIDISKESEHVEKLSNIIINIIAIIVVVIAIAIMIGLFLIAAGFVWNGVLTIWRWIL